MVYHVLVVDDDQFQCRSAQITIEKFLKYKVTTVTSGKEAINMLLGDEGRDINMVLLDLSMPEIDGMEVLKKVHPARPDLPIIIHTAHGDVKKAVDALRYGAVDFVEKQDGPERMKLSLNNARMLSTLNKEVQKMSHFSTGRLDFNDIIGISNEIKTIKRVAQKAAQSNIPMLIEGESGVGKELFARAIHSYSMRDGKNYVSVNCAAIPKDNVESVLFGHERGSFTNTVEKSIGKFREADGGTLFLDEVGELSLDVQAKLLRVLQDFEIEPVGSTKSINIDVRVISATNKDLKEAVRRGLFREDLYYRLNVFPIIIPPLRTRKIDIPVLIDHLVEKICVRESRKILPIDDKLVERLTEYSWPGNVRQLENALYKAIIICDNDVLKPQDFDGILRAIELEKGEAQHPDASRVGINFNQRNSTGFKTLANYEKEIIVTALEYHNWHISKVSKELGIGRSTLYRKMKEYGIEENGTIEEIKEFRA
jgi:DNA-binding NtrC family response regulator